MITIWNVILGIIVALWAFGFTQMKQLFSKYGGKQPKEQPGEA